MDKPLIIYHGKCADGFTAAWLANMAFHSQQLQAPVPTRPDDWVVDHHAAVYGDPPPDVTGRHVFILDFSYPPDVLRAMADTAAFITVIDHHATAIEALQDFEHPNVEVQLSSERSGAYLASLYFFPGFDPLDIVKLVDDRDRWVFADKRTKAFNAGLFSRPYKIGEWNKLADDVPGAVAAGEVLMAAKAKEINELLDTCMIWRHFAGREVPTANLPYMSASDACHEMLERHPSAPFAVAWFMRKDGKNVFSLRSRNGSQVDVSAIAKALGGGGHKHAAGVAMQGWPA